MALLDGRRRLGLRFGGAVRARDHDRGHHRDEEQDRHRLEREQVVGEQDLPDVGDGAELGARRTEPECYDDEGRVRYARVAQTAAFRTGLERLAGLLRERRVALMCAEKDPLTCHRTILICRELRGELADIRHIREDGSIEMHDAAESRLLALCKLPERDLFHTRDELIADAYERQARRIAYVADEPDAVGVS